MSNTSAGLIQHCQDKLGTPYVYGAKGEVLTQAILDRLARENPGTYTSTYKAKAAKYIGQRCTCLLYTSVEEPTVSSACHHRPD